MRAGADAACTAAEPRRVGVACSGGRDSLSLLHATLGAAQALGIEVVALHVNHGLQAEAPRWEQRLRSRCLRWARLGQPVRFLSHRVESHPAPGDSVEAWARKMRYAALADMARASGCDLVLLAQHRRDQAETVLLQALRGGGVAGLAAMPRRQRRDGIWWCRPWLDQPRERIDAYVRRHRLVADEDPSNGDPRHARNRLRLTVWPALTVAFNAAEQALADVASHAADAAQALAELAALDAKRVVDEAGLHRAPWLALSPARRRNLLRAWLQARSGSPAPASLVERLMRELPGARNGLAWPLGEHGLRLHREVLHWGLPPCTVPAAAGVDAPPAVQPLAIKRAGRVTVDTWGGVFNVKRVREGGIPLAWLAHAELRPRRGGEQFQAGIGRPPRSLKKQFQAAGVPDWGRHGPLVYSGGQLVFVPGLGLDARVIGLPGTPQVQLDWVPGVPAPAHRC